MNKNNQKITANMSATMDCLHKISKKLWKIGFGTQFTKLRKRRWAWIRVKTLRTQKFQEISKIFKKLQFSNIFRELRVELVRIHH